MSKSRRGRANQIGFCFSLTVYTLQKDGLNQKKWSSKSTNKPAKLSTPYSLFFSIMFSYINEYTLAQEMVATSKHKEPRF